MDEHGLAGGSHIGQGRRRAQRGQQHDSGLHRQASTTLRRRCATRSTRCTDRSRGSLATTAQDQTAAGTLSFDVAVDGGAFTTVTINGADWSGAGGDGALQTALQTALDTALGAGSATASTVAAREARCSTSASSAPACSTLKVAATGADPGFSTLLGTTAVGADGIGGRQFFTGTDAASFAVSSDVDGNPAAVAAGLAANGPLDGSNALNMADLATALAAPMRRTANSSCSSASTRKPR